ncbi:DUF1287 domain-containing protein [Collinsella tanakaei]|uniref:DUF1287 domain-containing protein n=1 Tax=Collinsella tanakaei TaxID=626935 RepID=UPI00195E619C|nr:DUF1287 domain-containing protein [Collinsella tanakaei]MBM6755370.1 DUF1287 domain-containing protein [Collinsella tanakaei]
MRGQIRHRLVGVLGGVLLLSVLVAAVLVATGAVNMTSAERPENHMDILFVDDGSHVDRDGDGIEDGQDILEAAIAYVRTRPRYRSAYYANGYPDDGFGVCTDVVAFALRDAGYDLRRLIADDIAAAPEAYDVETPDAAIDFRRTGNQLVYFERHAISLTTNPEDLSSWQPGDIVVFEGHVGIVSGFRNSRGIPYVIHHQSAFQLCYEEDLLESRRGDIVGHFRMAG